MSESFWLLPFFFVAIAAGFFLGKRRDRDRRGVRRNDRTWFPDFVYPLVHGLLDVEALDNCLGNPVDVPEFVEVVFDIANRNVLQVIPVKQTRLALVQ